MSSTSASSPRLLGNFGRAEGLILPLGLIATIIVILVPLPSPLVDVLLAANITLAVIMLLTTVYVSTPLEFSIFPTLLLWTTLVRLVLNVATTRLILTRGPTEGLDAAGAVVRSFGEFVAGDRIVVGMIIFLIIVVIQFVVITKGATRISEVAARFVLDGMPGRQMAIDADLNAGIIDEKEAQRRREEISRQADFFGAMDGASKFVRGDAIAGVVITLINIIGGLIIGVGEGGMSLSEAVSVYTKLTIGDGLVSQIPAFLVSVAAGVLITRSSHPSHLPSQFVEQLFSRPEALGIAGAFLSLLVFTRLPTIPLLTLGASCVGLAAVLSRRAAKRKLSEEASKQAEAAKKPEEKIEDFLTVDPLEIEIGVGLIRLADPKRGGDLLERIQRIRQHLAADIGIILPKVRIRDNFNLDPHQYRIKLHGVTVASGEVRPDLLLAIDSGLTTGTIPGAPTRDPAFGSPALWIEPRFRDQAELAGYTVVEPSAVIATHLTETVRKHADELLTRDATKHLIDQLKQHSPATVEELIPGVMKLAEVQQVLQLLLREQVPIRHLGLILETLGDYAPRTKDPVLLTEFVRARLGRVISGRYRDAEGRLWVVTLDPRLEDRIRAGAEYTERGVLIRMPPQQIEVLCRNIASAVQQLVHQHRRPIVLVSPQIRPILKQLIAGHLPEVIVLSYNEVTRDTRVESVAMVNDLAI
ncbi:MAG: flagellar biosynthesis protein FlhA [Thermoguttaceae bacterium]|nr:flagellar biosynthesis protein FlhA [Thermoguttaceae bacterium]MDW8077698.1 flagellar biosynthesis protein FlhA [Thermoguttaceae bacterium]